MNFNDFAEKYFTKCPNFKYRYLRKTDGYIHDAESVEQMMHYYNKTGIEP